jgi:hypothetical protein
MATEIPAGDLAAFELDNIDGVAWAAKVACERLPFESSWKGYFADLAAALEDDSSKIQLVPGPRSWPREGTTIEILDEHEGRFLAELRLETEWARSDLQLHRGEMSEVVVKEAHGVLAIEKAAQSGGIKVLISDTADDTALGLRRIVGSCIAAEAGEVHGAGVKQYGQASLELVRARMEALEFWVSLGERLERFREASS